jgi:hypothetical protein
VAGQRTGAIAVTVVVLIATATAEVGGGAPSRIVDRTLVCTPFALSAGLRDVDVITSPRGGPLLRGTVRADSVGYIALGSGAGSSADLVLVRARPQERYQQQPQAPGVYANTRRCSRAKASLPLSPRGLAGSPVKYASSDECGVRGRVLVRVRAVLESPTSWLGASGPYAGARKNVLEGMIAIRSERTRRPLAVLQLDRSGETKLWTSASCT